MMGDLLQICGMFELCKFRSASYGILTAELSMSNPTENTFYDEYNTVRFICLTGFMLF